MAKNGITPSEISLLTAMKHANGLKTAEEIAVALGKEESTVKQMVSTLNRKFKELGRDFPVPHYKTKKGGGGRRSSAVSVDDALAVLADLDIDGDESGEDESAE